MVDSRVLSSLFGMLEPAGIWFPKLQGHGLILNLQTTGRSPDHHRIVQIGLLEVRQGQARRRTVIQQLIQTPYDPELWGAVYSDTHPYQAQFAVALQEHDLIKAETLLAIDANGGSIMGLPLLPDRLQYARNQWGELQFSTARDFHCITPAQTLTEGVNRKELLALLAKVLMCSEPSLLIGHHLLDDLAFLQTEMKRELNIDLLISPHHVFDTGLAVKASQLSMIPAAGMTLLTFFQTAKHLSAKIPWPQDPFCVHQFNLTSGYNLQLNRLRQNAGEQCLATWCLFRELRRIAISNLPENHGRAAL